LTEPKDLKRLLLAIDDYVGFPSVVFALKLAPLLFVRPRELRNAQWAELDLDSQQWKIPAEKMKTGKIY
jgi:integrase